MGAEMHLPPVDMSKMKIPPVDISKIKIPDVDINVDGYFVGIPPVSFCRNTDKLLIGWTKRYGKPFKMAYLPPSAW
jgi:hypothetical protein